MPQHATAPTRGRRAATSSVATAGPRPHSAIDAPVEDVPEVLPEPDSEAHV